MDKKQCRTCKTEKMTLEFYNSSHHKDGKTPQCRECFNEEKKLRRELGRLNKKPCCSCHLAIPRGGSYLCNSCRQQKRRKAHDLYIKSLLSKQYDLDKKYIPQDFIEIKKAQLLLKQAIKDGRK